MWKINTKKQFGKVLQFAALSLCIVAGSLGIASADEASSTNYKVTETQFGTGAELNACSTNYCSKQSSGDTVVGEGSSTNYKAQFGFNTTTEPYLEVWTEGGSQDMGTLNSETTGTATNLIKVRNYQSSGYVMQITGTSPSQGTHSLNTMATPSTSNQGVEQFGMNLANNTSPDIGAAPEQVPSGTFSFGQAATDYGTADLFKYVNGDIVAQSTSSSGETDYTLSMIINVSNVTAGGRYTGTFSAVVVPVF